MHHHNSTYFSDNYQQARQLFCKTAQQAGAQLQSYECPHRGPDGDRLHMDVASIGNPEADTLFLITSAVHGVEGFAGSCIQSGLLNEGVAERVGSNVHMVMIHGVNPYGFAHIRRFNEDNVDVNRNFVRHPFAYPGNKKHAQLADVLAPKSLTWFSTVQLYQRIASFLLRNDFKSLAQGIGSGQNILPRGLYYGGNIESWSNLRVQAIIERYASTVKKLVVIDLHTGLGGFGDVVILVDKEQEEAYERAKGWWGDSKVLDTSKGLFRAKLNGTLQNAVSKLCPDKECTVATIEFGTSKWWQKLLLLPLISTRDENWLQPFGTPDTPEAKAIKEAFQNDFIPNSESWKVGVWLQGRNVVCDVLAGIVR